ncbi:MAG TPA: hypothetical protein VF762_03160 [Blastocatellia bacterium]
MSTSSKKGKPDHGAYDAALFGRGVRWSLRASREIYSIDSPGESS